ncbi:MAG: GH3 auxin-responsive promoter family protein [Fimbriiglobus sp.]
MALNTRWLAPVVDHRISRRIADAAFIQIAHRRARELDSLNVPQVQERTLLDFVRRAAGTKFGQQHRFDLIRTVADYQKQVPIRDYDAFWTEFWKDAYPNLGGITWPEKIPYYALSSGTTSGTTKYIPISREMVASNKKAAITTMALFRHAYPQAKTFTGKFFFLGGSTDLRTQADGSFAGDLSGIAAKEVLDFQRPFTFPPTELSYITDWDVKLRKLAEASLKEPITAISGVPSWMLKVFDVVRQISGKSTIAEAWPDFRLVIHGGTLFDPYREPFKQTIGSDLVKFCEVYPCSEGFIATEDGRYNRLRIVPDHGIFFEFIPVGELDSPSPTRLTLRDVQVGVPYAVVLTSCAGVWSYLVGDTIEFESVNPPLIRFTGRTKYFLSAFGEHLIQEEIDRAMEHAAKTCGVMTVDHHVGPIFPTDPAKPGHHRYYVEFRGPAPANLNQFIDTLDAELSRLNEDYAAHRVNDLTMLRPEVIIVRPEGFADWMKSRGKYGGQNKVPRMDNTGQITTQLGQWLAKN